VRAEVLQARAAGQLLKAGEQYDGFAAPAQGSGLTRAQVREQYQQAKATGEIMAAGDADPIGNRELAAPSTLARSDVKAEVLAARASGELLPAGDAYPEGHAARATTAFARASSRVVVAQTHASAQANAR
jgi:hypothetical protein